MSKGTSTKTVLDLFWPAAGTLRTGGPQVQFILLFLLFLRMAVIHFISSRTHGERQRGSWSHGTQLTDPLHP